MNFSLGIMEDAMVKILRHHVDLHQRLRYPHERRADDESLESRATTNFQTIFM